jgi:hypothetical protein
MADGRAKRPSMLGRGGEAPDGRGPAGLLAQCSDDDRREGVETLLGLLSILREWDSQTISADARRH